jgi:hypothetical protein
MSETTQSISEFTQEKRIVVCIDGDKSAFVSKAAVDKFKQSIKSNPNSVLEELVEKYVKPEYKLELVSSDNNEFKYKVIVKPVQKSKREKTEKEQRHELLKAKLNLMANARTNRDYHKAKNSGNVDQEILVEYQKLKKMTKMAIPEPGEILANPEQYRPMLSMVLSNSIMKQHGSSHPYVRYFTLLAEKIGATEFVPEPTENFGSQQTNLSNGIEEMMKNAGPSELKKVSGNSISNNNQDTDSESDVEDIDA